jgi:ABC-type nitrate/sulfonate/bicarbonate transport system substrate-binding protein
MARLHLLAALALLLLCSNASARDTVTLQLQWTHAFQFAGYYAAKEKGFYDEAGLDVLIRETTEDHNIADLVTRGEAEYGVGTSSLLLDRARGLPVVALAVTLQHSPFVLVAPLQSPAQDLAGLAGLRVMLEDGAADLEAMLRREDIFESIDRIPHSFDPQDLIDGRTDAYSAYSTNELFYFRERGFNTLTYAPQAAGIDFYGDTLFTSERELREHPERVAAFREASLRGWRYALENVEEVIQIILERYPTSMSPDHLRFEAAEQARLINADEIPLGDMSAERWGHIADVYAEIGMLAENFALDGFLYQPPRTAAPVASAPRRATAPTQATSLAAIAVILLVAAYALYLHRRLAHTRMLLEASEIELESVRHQFNLIADNIEDVVWTFDVANRRFTWISPSVRAQRGISPDKVIAATVDAAFTPADAERFANSIDEAIERHRSGQTGETMLRVEQPCADGTTIRVDLRYRVKSNEFTGNVEITGVGRRAAD